MSRLTGIVDRIGRVAGARFPPASPVGRFLRAVRRRLPRHPPEGSLGQVIFAFAKDFPRAFVIQIGAHDGAIVDPLRAELVRRPWQGILVEPVPYVFKRLQANYGANPRLILENVAIADAEGIREIHHLPESHDNAIWGGYDALGSFRRDVVLKHTDLVPDIESRLVSTPVQCLTFEGLCEKHGVDHLDVVQIDTEGYDLEILRLIDLQRWHPALVVYEHVHLDSAEQDEARAMLETNGYALIADEMDTLGIHGSALAAHPDLHRAWDGILAVSSGG